MRRRTGPRGRCPDRSRRRRLVLGRDQRPGQPDGLLLPAARLRLRPAVRPGPAAAAHPRRQADQGGPPAAVRPDPVRRRAKGAS